MLDTLKGLWNFFCKFFDYYLNLCIDFVLILRSKSVTVQKSGTKFQVHLHCHSKFSSHRIVLS